MRRGGDGDGRGGREKQEEGARREEAKRQK